MPGQGYGEDIAIENNQTKSKKEGQFRKRAISFLMIFFVIALSVGLFIFVRAYPDKVKQVFKKRNQCRPTVQKQ